MFECVVVLYIYMFVCFLCCCVVLLFVCCVDVCLFPFGMFECVSMYVFGVL